MDILNFREELLARVHVRASAEGNFMHAAFTEVAGDLLEEAEELSDFYPCYVRHQTARRRKVALDGYVFDDADGSVRLMITRFNGAKAHKTLTKTEAKSIFAQVMAFVDEALAGRLQGEFDEATPEYGLARDLEARTHDIVRLRFFLATDDILSERVKDWPEGEIGGIPAEFHIWDAGRFHRAAMSVTGRDEIEIDFESLVPGGLACLPASVDSENYEGYLGVIPGRVLADIYETFGSRLLEANVRAFLNTTVKVNKGIRTTISSEPSMFFAYNNGIAATATKVRTSQDGGVVKLLSATDFQIVNGGQTTASLSNARRKDNATLDHIFVQMKVSVVGEEQAEKIIPNISRFANSQNKVSDADFFANHEYHRNLEKISRRIRAPARKGSQVETHWFYERARGQYLVELNRLSGSRRKAFELENPRDQVLTKTDLAKVENAWRQLPHEVSKGAQKNFIKFAEFMTKEWERDRSHFGDEYFRTLIAHTILFRKLEELVPKQPWYDGGYRANIVAYSVAKLAQLIESEGRSRVLDTSRIWREQAVGAALERQLIAIAERMYYVIVKPEQGIQNVTEWCKKEAAWSRAKSVKTVVLSPAVSKELVDQATLNRIPRNDSAHLALPKGKHAQAEVIRFGIANWAKLRDWAERTGMASAADMRWIRLAASPGPKPTESMGEVLVAIREKLRTRGFPG